MASTDQALTVKDEFRRGWKIILVAAIGLGCGLSALPIYSIGVLTKPLTVAFGISRGDVQSVYTWMTIGNLIASPFLGMAIDRMGVRKITLISIALMAIGMATMSLAESLWHLYIIGFCMSVVGVGTVPITWTRVIIDWFGKGRGFALGLALAGTGIAAVFLPMYTNWLVANFSWRGAYVGIACLPALLALPLSYFLLHDRTTGSNNTPATAAEQKEVGFGEVLTGYRFWVMIVAFFLVGACVAGLISALVPILTDRGVTSASAAQVASVIGIMVIISRIGTGYLLDRFWAPGVALILLSIPAVACFILASGIGGIPGAILAAATIGLAAGAEFDVMSFMVGRYFGQRRYGIIYSCLYASFKLSAGVGAPIFGYSFDNAGNYNFILYVAAGALVAGSALLLTLGPYVIDAHGTHRTQPQPAQ